MVLANRRFGGVAGVSPAEGVGAYWRGLCRIRAIRPAGAAMSLRSIRRANGTAGGDVPQKTEISWQKSISRHNAYVA